ncbi:hypothetical protein U9M48_018658 [Paspalum notatum var. saurae]|uniref:Uncharacterized protein n=1 Tax=Paspalum notatum var. saurae TaxID=547442 RepID=A0AAQ3TB39_PASNO
MGRRRASARRTPACRQNGAAPASRCAAPRPPRRCSSQHAPPPAAGHLLARAVHWSSLAVVPPPLAGEEEEATRCRWPAGAPPPSLALSAPWARCAHLDSLLYRRERRWRPCDEVAMAADAAPPGLLRVAGRGRRDTGCRCGRGTGRRSGTVELEEEVSAE